MAGAGPESDAATTVLTSNLGISSFPSAAKSDAFHADFAADPRPAAIVALWPSLPEPVKTAWGG
jgi:hypothetical protein